MEAESLVATADLLACCAAGAEDDSAWDAFIERIQGRVRGGVIAALTRCGEPRDPDFVDDLVQDVWCRLLERDRRILQRCRGTSEGEVMTYLRRVAASVVVDALRARGALKRRADDLVSISGEAEWALRLVDRTSCPERRAIATQRLRMLLRACRRGSRTHPVDRAFADRTARSDRGLELGEIAALFDGSWTRPAIDSTLYRVRRKLTRLGIRIPRRPGGSAAAVRPRRLRRC